MNGESFYKSGYNATIANAHSLFDSAEILAERKQYGHAVALLVLSAEEAIKAISIFGTEYFPSEKYNDWDKVFIDHKYKLESIRGIITMAKIMSQLSHHFYGELLLNLDKPQEEIERMRKDGFNRAIQFLKDQTTSKKTDMKKEAEWWKHAKSLKENGLYVCLENNKWRTPQMIKKTAYLQTKDYVSFFVGAATSIANIDFTEESIKGMLQEYLQIVEDK